MLAIPPMLLDAEDVGTRDFAPRLKRGEAGNKL